LRSDPSASPGSHDHARAPRTAVVLANLGTPDTPDTGAVRRYLREFLSDRRVIDLPRALWLPILYGVILPFRSPRSAAAYRRIWRADGSPLRVFSSRLVDAVRERLPAGPTLSVHLAMRYGQPSVEQVVRELARSGVRRLLVLPLYPQYSGTTTASVFDAVAHALGRSPDLPELRLVRNYHDDPAWLDAVAAGIRAHRANHGAGEHLVFSFHGIPVRYFHAGDPYHCECQRSAREIAERLALPREAWSVSFQSRVGRERWLEPYTDQHLAALAGRGVKRVDVVCPGFSVDCLETLEEIEMLNAEGFREHGGEWLHYVPALNDTPAHADLLAALVRRQCSDWPPFCAPYDAEAARLDGEARVRRQRACAAAPGDGAAAVRA